MTLVRIAATAAMLTDISPEQGSYEPEKASGRQLSEKERFCFLKRTDFARKWKVALCFRKRSWSCSSGCQ